jgi:hypothetical protein
MPLTTDSEKAFQFIDMKELQRRAPSAFTEIPANRTSDRYIHIPTPLIVADLIASGWEPVDAYEVRPKKEENKGYQKHFIRFRNRSVYVGHSFHSIEYLPELLLVNSYDARCAFKLYMALHRVVCKNMLLIKSEELENMHIPHKGWKHEEIYDLIEAIRSNTSQAIEWMNRLKAVQLSKQQQSAFAQECCRARWDYKYVLTQPKQLLDPWREEDKGDDLFIVFNRIQEKIIKGGWTGSAGRAIKPLKDPNRELIVNSKLFQIVDNFYSRIIRHKL